LLDFQYLDGWETLMTLDDIRMVLLGQHASLRGRISDARLAAERWKRDECTREEMQDCLERLAAELRAHHACEERLLRHMGPAVGHWGQSRMPGMSGVHLDEHRILCAGLIGATIATTDAESGADGIILLLDAMLEHMSQEERIFLSDQPGRDCFVAGDVFDA
jgi:hypothetical protein